MLTSLVILLPTLVGALCWREFVWFPLGLLATHWLVLFFILRDHANAAQSPRILRLIFWLLPVTALIGGAVLALLRSGFDAYALIVTILYLSFGLMFLVLGNILPKVRQNNTIGIKIKWTLENEQNWNATHRFSGRLWVIGGILCMACALVAESAIAMVYFLSVCSPSPSCQWAIPIATIATSSPAAASRQALFLVKAQRSSFFSSSPSAHSPAGRFSVAV